MAWAVEDIPEKTASKFWARYKHVLNEHVLDYDDVQQAAWIGWQALAGRRRHSQKSDYLYLWLVDWMREETHYHRRSKAPVYFHDDPDAALASQADPASPDMEERDVLWKLWDLAHQRGHPDPYVLSQYLQGVSFSQIGRSLGLTESRACQRLHRLVRDLQDRIVHPFKKAS